jgi:oligosaccharide repeat unit polymerase
VSELIAHFLLDLFFRPYFYNNDIIYSRLKVTNNNLLNIIFILFIFCSFIAIYYSFYDVLDNIKSGEWLLIRNQLYNQEIILYTNQIEHFSLLFTQYFNLAVLVILFYYLTLKRTKSLFIILLIIALIVPTSFAAINTASRGMLVNLFFNLVLAYLIFQKGITKSNKKIIKISTLIFLILMLIFSISVTISRFGESDQNSSLLFYFGHSFMTFNYGVADSIKEFLGGKFFFNWFYDLFGLVVK